VSVPATSRVLVTGAAGMLGSELIACAPAGASAIGTDLIGGASVALSAVDLSDPASLDRIWREHGPFDGVIHCAAYTAVDKAEEQPELAHKVNAFVCGVLARACAERGAQLVAVSTDFVFDGHKRTPYVESDAAKPLSVYGKTKLEGEHEALAAHPRGTAIVRTQWLYGPRGKHFPGTILNLAREKPELKVVHDQVGSPTSTIELAPALWDVLARGEAGIYHAACEGHASWYDFAAATLATAGVSNVRVTPCTTAEFPRPAVRPAYSVLDCSRLAALRGRRLAPWKTALSTFLSTNA
jgi:dTDP-4-dehydrorhamnose reductase